MPQFMLLLYSSGNTSANLSPEEMQKVTEKYMAWRTKTFTRDGRKLTDDSGRVIRRQGSKPTVKDGPFSETKEVLAGYYTIEAGNYDEAVRLALENPHLEYGGSIEVRQIFGT
jgi:hypothetical protein